VKLRDILLIGTGHGERR